MTGYDVAAGGSLDEALASLEAHGRAPDAIVADYRLGHGRSGSAAIRNLRRTYGRGIPGILLTGDTSPDRLKEAKESGFELLHKPVRPQELIDAILRLTQS